MPIYEYVCSRCDHGFEALVSTREAAPHCPRCDGAEVKKQLSVFAAKGEPTSTASSPSFGGCGTCGDPRGPGACRLEQ